MLRAKTTTRLTVAIFIAALFCASLCPMTCALSFCPAQSQDSATQDCDHSSSDPGGATHHHNPTAPGCTTHHDLASNLVKPAGLDQFHATAARHASSFDLLSVSALAAHINLNALVFSDSAPLPKRTSPLYERLSVLRI